MTTTINNVSNAAKIIEECGKKGIYEALLKNTCSSCYDIEPPYEGPHDKLHRWPYRSVICTVIKDRIKFFFTLTYADVHVRAYGEHALDLGAHSYYRFTSEKALHAHLYRFAENKCSPDVINPVFSDLVLLALYKRYEYDWSLHFLFSEDGRRKVSHKLQYLLKEAQIIGRN